MENHPTSMQRLDMPPLPPKMKKVNHSIDKTCSKSIIPSLQSIEAEQENLRKTNSDSHIKKSILRCSCRSLNNQNCSQNHSQKKRTKSLRIQEDKNQVHEFVLAAVKQQKPLVIYDGLSDPQKCCLLM